MTAAPIQQVNAGIPGYRAYGATFDGTNSRLNRGANLTGIATGKKGLVSFWYQLNGTDTAELDFLFSGGGYFGVDRANDNKWDVIGLNSSVATILHMRSTGTHVASVGWHHFASSWDLSAGVGKIYVDGVDETAASPTLTNDTINYVTATADFFVGNNANTGKINAAVADFYINLAEYLDLTVAANLAKFISAAGTPVYLGATGQLPTGTAPLVFLQGRSGSFTTNLGTGGNFTLTGTLTDPTTSPSN